jgi:PEP-CTERM motif
MKRSLALIAVGLALVGNAHAVNTYVFGFSDNSASGSVLTINGVSRGISFAGSYSSTGFYDPTDVDRLGNYMAGHCDSCLYSDYRNFFVVNLAGLTAPVTSLTFTLDSFTVSSAGIYTLWDYASSESITQLKAGGLNWTSIYDDLGSQAVYGSRNYMESDSDLFRTLELNQSARNDLNAAISGGKTQWAFGGSFAPSPIPEPETYALMLAGLGMVGWMAKRRRKC